MEHILVFDSSNRMPRSDGLADPQQCAYLLRHFLLCQLRNRTRALDLGILHVLYDDILNYFPSYGLQVGTIRTLKKV